MESEEKINKIETDSPIKRTDGWLPGRRELGGRAKKVKGLRSTIW